MFKYIRDNNEIIKIQILDKDAVENLPATEQEKLQENMQMNPDWFKN